MSKLIATIALIFVFLSTNLAYSGHLKDLYFPEDGKLSKNELSNLEKVQKWRNGETEGIKPFTTSDGSIKFFFGTSQPVIAAAVLQVTDIELERGESVNGINIGDEARWKVTPAITGTGRGQIEHIIIKPWETNLQTSLIVTTNRRTYHMVLKSYKDTYMPRVAFVYPGAYMDSFDQLRQAHDVKVKKLTIDGTNQNIEELDFDYKVSGNGKWVPVRVYNDGIRTIIQMPKKMQNGEAPSLLVLRAKTNEKVLVNYRIQKERYIVDNVFDKAILIAGVGKNQEKITIEREGI